MIILFHIILPLYIIGFFVFIVLVIFFFFYIPLQLYSVCFLKCVSCLFFCSSHNSTGVQTAHHLVSIIISVLWIIRRTWGPAIHTCCECGGHGYLVTDFHHRQIYDPTMGCCTVLAVSMQLIPFPDTTGRLVQLHNTWLLTYMYMDVAVTSCLVH